MAACSETQLRAEVASLRRQNNSLQRRVSQLQGLLGELQPLWMSAPPGVQEQVQLALQLNTPRAGACAAVLNPSALDLPCRLACVGENSPMPEEDTPREGASSSSLPLAPALPCEMPISKAPAERWSPCWPSTGYTPQRPRGKASGSTSSTPIDLKASTVAPAFSGEKSQQQALVPPIAGLGGEGNSPVPVCQLTSAPTPPDTERHRLDGDDSASSADEQDARGGGAAEMTVSVDHYHEVVSSWKDEISNRQNLEEEIAALRKEKEEAPAPCKQAMTELEEALAREELSRSNVMKYLDEIDGDLAWQSLSLDAVQKVPRPHVARALGVQGSHAQSG